MKIKEEISASSLSEKFRRGELLDAKCPSREVLKRLTSRWSLLVLLALEEETLRFGELRRKIGGVSERMLAQTLRHMEEDGFVTRIDHQMNPPHVDYSLSPLGYQVRGQVTDLADWIEMNLQQIMDNRRTFAASSEQHDG
ncbi:winged helix-turn-helix transcriptional regulator [Erwinia mallotivora]|uniref:Transcriptional regulator n=1 Tax=Erwinia mallotivora TaxID=69222 RepID=A0A014M6E7_9GAMM|nr:helix-turn-helix domain-containing protein [Erwinia mallotivora]EXU77366.1 transcriptional regulator [Erwinia mallotivora]